MSKNKAAVHLGRLSAESRKRNKDKSYWENLSQQGVEARKKKREAAVDKVPDIQQNVEVLELDTD